MPSTAPSKASGRPNLASLLHEALKPAVDHALADLDVLGHPVAVIQRAMLAPDLAGLPGHAAVGRKVLLRHRHDKSIDVSHGRPPVVQTASRAIVLRF